ncbi:NYN domain-containing protein [Roseobacter sp. HKCCA0434]|uniref:NYN domain-containing protein n=1 Tax=Roseobacter sp. HKCCA0434 TaxID=3079297 RepID=UPI002905CA9D|nr:NYN domain-containing protein [Roseobacter sp. HKCCA0434]
MAETSRKLAVLIDADNTNHNVAHALFDEIARLGEANVRRIYGDYTRSEMSGWDKKLATHALIPTHQPAYVKGKNASDITMVIDAMDLLHRGSVDGFCLVSSDSDFTRLAQRIKEEGAVVYGFGEQKTPEAFRAACTRFIYNENLMSGQNGSDMPEKRRTEPPSAALPILRGAIAELEEEDDWVSLGVLGQRISNARPDFDARTYGCASLSKLVEKTGAFDVSRDAGNRVVVRRKD